MIATGLRIAIDTFSPLKFYRQHKCLVISLLTILLFVGILGVSYHAPHLAPKEQSISLTAVAKLVEETVPCGGSGFPEGIRPGNRLHNGPNGTFYNETVFQ
jgi:hypothetical protein